MGFAVTFVAGDHIACRNSDGLHAEGKVEQVGAPDEVYNTPASEFVATFLGASNLLPARVIARDDTGVILETSEFGETHVPAARATSLGDANTGQLMIRAEKLHLSDGSAQQNTAQAVVSAVDYQGQLARYFVQIGDTQLQAINMITGSPFKAGDSVNVQLAAQECSALPAKH